MTSTGNTSTASSYALDSAWHAERERLSSITRLYDPGSLEVFRRLGARDGWTCLDVGAGTGSIAQALGELVAPSGSVVALDIDTRFLAPLASAQLRVVASDITREPPPADSFDLVHARLVLEHLTERDRVLDSLIAAARPGGWVVIEDFDWSTAFVVDPPSEAHDRVVRAIIEVFGRHGYDSSYGRRLPRHLRAAGLTDVGTRAETIQVWADRERGLPQWELLADQLAAPLAAAGLVTEEELDAFHALWHDGETICFSPIMVSCYGRRPAPD